MLYRIRTETSLTHNQGLLPIKLTTPYLVRPLGIEPSSLDFQSSAMTSLAQVAKTGGVEGNRTLELVKIDEITSVEIKITSIKA